MKTNKRELKRYKKKAEYSYAFGVYPTLDILENRPDIIEILVISPFGDANEGVAKIKELASKNNIEVITSQRLILKLSKKENTYAIAKFRKFDSQLDSEANHIVLDNPSDLGNLGTIMRTMLGMRYRNLAIIKPAVDIFDPRVVRSTMGAMFQTNFQYFESIEEYCEKFQTHNLYCFMLDKSEDIENVEVSNKHSLVFGNEGQGLDDKFAKIGTPVRISQEEGIDSFNLAISASLGMYIVKRKQD